MDEQENTQPQTKTSPLAIIALILAFVFPIVGLIVGIIALVKINSNPTLSGRKMAIAAIVIGVILTILPVILVSIGALAFFGVLNPSKFVPDRCVASAGLTCVETAVIHEDGTVEFEIRNGLGQSMTITKIEASDDCTLESAVTVDGGPISESTIAENAVARLSAKCEEFDKESVRAKFTLQYTSGISGFEHIATVDIAGKAR